MAERNASSSVCVSCDRWYPVPSAAGVVNGHQPASAIDSSGPRLSRTAEAGHVSQEEESREEFFDAIMAFGNATTSVQGRLPQYPSLPHIDDSSAAADLANGTSHTNGDFCSYSSPLLSFPFK